MKKLMIFVLFTLCSTLCAVTNASNYSVGFEKTTLYVNSDRPLSAYVWYPTDSIKSPNRIAENLAFIGTDVVTSALPSLGKFPLVVISHGYRGNWRNQNWLATKLAEEGYVVASIDHPGTTTFDHSEKQAIQWWERPNDISRLVDWLLKASDKAPFIDQLDITAIGHSLGGWTVMALAGAEFDRDQLIQECQIKASPRTCGLAPELGLDKSQSGEPTTSLKDDRIQRVVSLDLGLARGFSRRSLQQIEIPTLILAAGVDIGDLPQIEESGFLAQYIPKAKYEYKVYSDAAHFSFMQLCKSGAIALIEEESPSDGIVCQDGGQRTRSELHNVIYQDILSFIESN